MIVPFYTSGDWLAVITDGAVALLPPTIDDERLEQVWEALRESSDLTHSLTVLARGGLVGLPPFALVSVVDGHVRGFLRGDVRLLTSDADGTREHSAAHVATWAEINVSDAGAVTVAVPAEIAPSRRGPRMPALAAVVRASSVEVRLRESVEAPSPVPAVPAQGTSALSETTTRDGLDLSAPGDLVVPDGLSAPDRSGSVPAVRAARRALAVDEGASAAAPAPSRPSSAPVPQPSPDPARDAERAREYVARRARATSSARGVPAVRDADPAGARRDVDPAAARPDVDPVAVARRPAATSASPLSTRTTAAVPPPPVLPDVVEMTVVPAVEPGPVEIELTGPDVAALVSDDDRYGSTVLSTSLVEIRRQMNEREPAALPGPFPVPEVPRVHKLRMSSGLLVPLDRAVLIGRAPVVSRVAARDLPRLVTVTSPNQDISRTHAQVHTDGEHVLVTDLNSTNGMLLTEPGQAPRRLRSGEPTPISPGSLVDLGDGVTFTLERDR